MSFDCIRPGFKDSSRKSYYARILGASAIAVVCAFTPDSEALSVTQATDELTGQKPHASSIQFIPPDPDSIDGILFGESLSQTPRVMLRSARLLPFGINGEGVLVVSLDWANEPGSQTWQTPNVNGGPLEMCVSSQDRCNGTDIHLGPNAATGSSSDMTLDNSTHGMKMRAIIGDPTDGIVDKATILSVWLNDRDGSNGVVYADTSLIKSLKYISGLMRSDGSIELFEHKFNRVILTFSAGIDLSDYSKCDGQNPSLTDAVRRVVQKGGIIIMPDKYPGCISGVLPVVNLKEDGIPAQASPLAFRSKVIGTHDGYIVRLKINRHTKSFRVYGRSPSTAGVAGLIAGLLSKQTGITYEELMGALTQSQALVSHGVYGGVFEFDGDVVAEMQGIVQSHLPFTLR